MGKIYFVVTDVHGFYNEMAQALQEKGFSPSNEDHIFVSLGDLLDRGAQPTECLKFVNALPKERKILIRGNHEDLLDSAIQRNYFEMHDFHNGTVGTVMALAGIPKVNGTSDYTRALYSMQNNKLYGEYKKQLVDYYELGNNILVHGWIPCREDAQHNENGGSDKCYTFIDDWKNGDWEKARWINGMRAWKNGVKLEGKTIFCGHWHTSWGHHYIDGVKDEFYGDAVYYPFVKEGICALDACTALSHQVNVAIIKEE